MRTGDVMSVKFAQEATRKWDTFVAMNEAVNKDEEPDLKCPFCHGKFTRSYHACDCCARSRIGCDGRLPCSSCWARKQLCTYNRVSESLPTGSRVNGSPTLPDVALESGRRGHADLDPRADIGLTVCAVEIKFPHDSTHGKSSQVTTVVFLLHYTNPRNDNIQDYFMSPSSLSDKAAVVESDGAMIQDQDRGMLQPWIPTQAGMGGASTEGISDLELVCEVDFWVADRLDNHREWLPHYGTNPDSSLDQLQINLCSISSALCATSKGQLSFTAYSMLVEATDFIFAPQRARTYVESYFDNWHPHCPMLHPASFDFAHAFPPLSAAVILMGASFSSKKAAMAAQVCLDAAEEYIFGHQNFLQLVDPACGEKPLLDATPLQAAFILVLLQHWNNHGTAWRKIRQYRYPDIVRAARNMGLPSLRHRGCLHGEASDVARGESWGAFIKTEESISLIVFNALMFASESIHRSFCHIAPQVATPLLATALTDMAMCVVSTQDAPSMNSDNTLDGFFPEGKVGMYIKEDFETFNARFRDATREMQVLEDELTEKQKHHWNVINDFISKFNNFPSNAVCYRFLDPKVYDAKAHCSHLISILEDAQNHTRQYLD
ncbi:hypothetical protein LRP88_02188 [Fusarium phalaenopsidis]